MATLLHVAAIAAFFLIPMRVIESPVYVTLPPLDLRPMAELPPFAGPVAGGGTPGGERPVGPTRTPRARAPDVVGQPATPDSAEPRDVWLPVGPRLGDGRPWVTPRPALPARVADALYGDHEFTDSMALARLQTMVDSVMLLVDAMQRDRQLPSWTTDIAGGKLGIDSQFIHIGPIKIPAIALAMLPIGIQGNSIELSRARELQSMREDLIRAAARTETLDEFKRYAKELRERKDAEREAELRRKEQQEEQERKAAAAADTVRAVP